MSFITEWTSAPWPLVFVLWGAVAYLMAASVIELLARRRIRSFRQLVEEMLAEAPTEADRAMIRYYVQESAREGQAALFIATSPLLIGAAAISTLFLKGPAGSGDVRAELSSIRARLDRLDVELDASEARMILRATGHDPRKGRFWNDPRRFRLARLSESVAGSGYPSAMMVAGLYIVLASPFIAIWFVLSVLGLVAGLFLRPLVRRARDDFRAAIADRSPGAANRAH